jgi:multicomponent Na+:H+ antiporter subunit F
MTLLMLCVLVAGVAALIGVYRLLAGPSSTDRVVGLDILFSVAVVLCLIAAWASRRTIYLDVAIGLALVGFVATLAWARLITRLAQSNRTENVKDAS